MKFTTTNGYEFEVDECDAELAAKYKWHYVKPFNHGYICAGTRRLHRMILNAPKGTQVDHIDHDTLNNRRSNLRLATPAENSRNMRKKTAKYEYKGIYFQYGHWAAAVRVNGETKRIGQLQSAEAAAREYDKLARFYHGEFACLNFPQEQNTYPPEAIAPGTPTKRERAVHYNRNGKHHCLRRKRPLKQPPLLTTDKHKVTCVLCSRYFRLEPA